jgi:transposase-like protein
VVVRARIVLAAADGQSNAGIARELRIVVDTVRKWRTQFCQQGLSAYGIDRAAGDLGCSARRS